jgi:hypothetical protein
VVGPARHAADQDERVPTLRGTPRVVGPARQAADQDDEAEMQAGAENMEAAAPQASGADQDTAKAMLPAACGANPDTAKGCIILENGKSQGTAIYVTKNHIVQMSPVDPRWSHVPFAPQPVVNWIYQALSSGLCVLQKLLGANKRFQADGTFRADGGMEPASGGQVVVFWGTEIGARRDQGLIAWDYDGDLAVFKTPDCDFNAVWSEAMAALGPLGLRLIQHSEGSLG